MMMLLRMPIAGLLALFAVQMTGAQGRAPDWKMISSGTPAFDCKARAAAWEYGK